MARLVLVRHGKAAAGWNADHDPGLDEEGTAQAEAMATVLAPTGPLPIIVSPLRRTRETAAPLERIWSAAARVEPGVGEIPSPTDDLAGRGVWLRQVMQGQWSSVDDASRAWRERVLETLLTIAHDAVVVSHFIAINVAVGAARNDDRVVVFGPDHCSRTVVETTSSGLELVERGGEAVTVVR